MKIAYLFGSLNRGGTETLMLDVCKNLQQADFEAIGVYRKKGVLEDDFLSTSVPFYFLPIPKNKIKYLLQLRTLLIKEKIDIVHAHQPIDALLAYFATCCTNIRVFLSIHGFNFQASNILLGFILHRTAKNIFVSQYQKRYYLGKYKLKESNQHVVYNGIDFSKFVHPSIDNAVSNIKQELGIGKEVLLMGMVGNFNLVRNQMFVCRFLKLLNEQGVNFHFVFVGKRIEGMSDRFDNCVAYCQHNHLSSKVTFLGVRNDVPAILHALDVFVYATEQDTFGIAVTEAIAAGIPVFVNDWGVMQEITEQGKLATLYKTKDVQDLLNKYMLYLKNKETYKIKAESSALAIKNKYSIQKHIENLSIIYHPHA